MFYRKFRFTRKTLSSLYLLILASILISSEKASHANPTADLWQGTLEGNAQMVSNAIRNGADLSYLGRLQYSVLTGSAELGNLSVLRVLLTEGGLSPDDRDGEGRTALAVASSYGHKEIVRELLASGANVNLPDTYPALMAASQSGHIDIVRDLIDAGADVTAVYFYRYSGNSTTATQQAAKKGHTEIVQLLSEAITERQEPQARHRIAQDEIAKREKFSGGVHALIMKQQEQDRSHLFDHENRLRGRILESEEQELEELRESEGDLALVKSAIARMGGAGDTCTCSICQEPFLLTPMATSFEVVMPDCKHTFHGVCIQKWLEKKDGCPYCRQPLSTESVIPKTVQIGA